MIELKLNNWQSSFLQWLHYLLFFLTLKLQFSASRFDKSLISPKQPHWWVTQVSTCYFEPEISKVAISKLTGKTARMIKLIISWLLSVVLMVLKGPIFPFTLKLQRASWHWLYGVINCPAIATRVSEETMSIKFCYLHIFRNIQNIIWKCVFFLLSVSSLAVSPFHLLFLEDYSWGSGSPRCLVLKHIRQTDFL